LIAVPLVLLSPVIAFLMALAVEILIVLLDEGAPAVALVGAGMGGLVLFRRQRRGATSCDT